MRFWRLAVPPLLLLALWQVVDGPAALAALRGVDPLLWLAALALLNVQILASALRWRLTAGFLGQSLGRGQAVAEYYLATLGNMVLPGGVLGDAGRAVRAQSGVGLAVAAQAVMIERLAGQVALFALLLPALALLPGIAAGPVLALGVLLGAGAVLVVAGPGWARRFGAQMRRAWLSPGALPRQLALSAVILAANIGAFALCSAAVGAPLGALALVLVPLALLAMLIPLSVGGWGLREGAAGLLWPLAGATSEAGIAASIAFGLAALASGLPGLLVPLLRR
ncbi:flippase-like domain-containing protein [Halovulum dunhuangense]|uniref:Flippase-like domain-containing protein n=1 Tax=Halovulum dunhuangense TaxID=1505036 RepID=A0A849KUZ0_9RHOB|nr:lysylphosphatidylglycerol synthase transmembrane domain-containing protein [Halovulum dunhuangense]NNU79451.1 flippase-like domain-containing protein [Halovulum dunhuangense]